MKKKIKLALSGSGTLFYYHVGALKKILEDHEVIEVIGTSGGSIIASLLAMGYSIDRIEKIANEIDLSQHLDYSWNIFDRFGLLEGNKIKQVLKKYLGFRLIDTKIPLTIVVTDYTNKKEVYVNNRYNPYGEIAEYVRASISIPFLFKWVNMDNKVYIDGGVINNFPIDFFDSETIGVKIEGDWTNENDVKGFFPSLLNKIGINYIMNLVGLMMSATEKKHIDNAIFSKIIKIKTRFNGNNFNFTQAEKLSMINEGYVTAENFLKEKI